MRQIGAENIYHIYNRSVLKIPIFRCPPDYVRFLVKMSQFQIRYPVKILAYCLMPNHFHFLLEEPAEQVSHRAANISLFLQQLQNAYAKYFACKYEHSGRLFQGTFKSRHINDDGYYLKIIEYIHENPVKKKLTKKAEDWPYSSARSFYKNITKP